MTIALRKLWRDLWLNRARTLLVLLSLALGVTALGVLANARSLVERYVLQAYQASRPAHLRFFIGNGLADEALLASLSRLPGIAAVEGAMDGLDIEWKPRPEADWQPASLTTRADFAAQVFDLVTLRAGDWPSDDSAAAEINAIGQYGGVPEVGGTIYLRINNRPRPFVLSGAVHDPRRAPPPIQRKPVFYLTRGAYEALVEHPGFPSVKVALTDYSPENVDAALALIDERLRAAGLSMADPMVEPPDRHFAADYVEMVFGVLRLTAVVALAISGVLVVNTVSALMAQQVTQVGILKAIGGRRRQIGLLYLAGAGLYGALSLGAAAPLGALGGYGLTRFMLWTLNIAPAPFQVTGTALALQLAAGLAAPMLAAAWPVWQGTAVPVREALVSYGLGSSRFGAGALERLALRVRGLPLLLGLALRNTVRNPRRMLLTELTLFVTGLAFITGMSVRASLAATVEANVRSQGFDVQVLFNGPQRVSEVQPLLGGVEGVTALELWAFTVVPLHRPEASSYQDQAHVVLFGVPGGSNFWQPRLVAGRGLGPGDEHGLVLDQAAAAALGIGVGEAVVTEMPGAAGEVGWTVVGLAADDLESNQPVAYVDYDTLIGEQRRPGTAGLALLRSTAPPGTARRALSALEARGIGAWANTAEQEIEATMADLNALFGVLFGALGLIAVVSSLGLAGTLALGVIERRREIGLLRSAGANGRQVAGLYVGEGVLLGLAAWALAAALAAPVGRVALLVLGQALHAPLVAVYDPMGAGLWLAVVLVLSLLASSLPARSAARVSVRESLAYL